MSVSAPWNIYNKELFHHGFGTALWEPEPTQHGEVLLGDVGYLREGVFFRLFNATRNEDDEIHTTYGVPDKFEPLQLNTFGIHTRPNALPAGALCSKSVLSRSAGAGTSLHDVSLSFRIECTRERGAFLVLKDTAEKQVLYSEPQVIEYMQAHHNSWRAFAKKLGTSLSPEDIIFICGWVKTTEWALGAFTDGKSSVKLELSTSLPVGAGASFQVSHTEERSAHPICRIGPQGRDKSSDKPPSKRRKGKQTASTSQAPEPPLKNDQCVFIHYYKMKPRFLGFAPRVIKAAAGPDELPPSPDDDWEDPPRVLASDTSGEVDPEQQYEVVRNPELEKPYDPVDALLNYILEENSEVQIANANSISLVELHKRENEEISDIPAFLKRVKPQIIVRNGVGTLSPIEPDISMVCQEDIRESSTSEFVADLDNIAGPSQPMEVDGIDEVLQPETEHPGVDDSMEEEDAIARKLQQAPPSTAPAEAEMVSVSTLAYSKDGNFYAAGMEDSRVIIWDGRTGEKVGEHSEHEEQVCALEFSPNHRHLASGSADHTIVIWDVVSCEIKARLQGHTDLVEVVRYSPDGKIIASGSVDYTIRLWDASTGQCIRTIGANASGHRAIITTLAFSNDGKRLLSGGADCMAYVWNVASGDNLTSLRGHSNIIHSLSYDPITSHRAISTSDDGSIVVWDADVGLELMTLRQHQGSIRLAMFSADGKRLLSIGDEGSMKICDSYSGEVINTWDVGDENITTAAFSPDGKLFSVGVQNGVVRIFDTETGTQLKELDAGYEHEYDVTNLCFSPSGKHLVSTDETGARFWSLEDVTVPEVY